MLIAGLIGLALMAAGLALLWQTQTRLMVGLGSGLLIIGWVILIVFGTAAHGRGLGRRPSDHPAGCPARAWCGCYLASYLGISDRKLWLARAWARVGSPASGPQAGAIVVWPHHVGLIRAAEGNRILVLSGNDGHRVRERWRSTRGVIAYRTGGGIGQWP